MDPVLKTERLKLTLITRAERGSEELSWLHELRSNKQTMAWRYVRSITNSSKRICSSSISRKGDWQPSLKPQTPFHLSALKC